MVDLRTDGIYGLFKELDKGRRLVCFGAGKHFDTVLQQYLSWRLEEHISLILDNAPQKCNGIKEYQGKQYSVISPAAFLKEDQQILQDTVVLITSHLYSMEIVKQLDEYKEFEHIPVYVAGFLSDVMQEEAEEFEILPVSEPVIPKVIHYCWFGGGPVPDEYLFYMQSWKKFCPEYTIKRWDESNFDITQNAYMKEAYEHKKWAFVSDYARLKIIYEEGGIYLDCDVELLKSLDAFLGENLFCGFEDLNHIALGLGFGAVKGHPYLKKLMDYYTELHFINADGSLNLIPCPSYQTSVIQQFGIDNHNSYQKKNGITVYPTEVFAPRSVWGKERITQNTHSIHHYGASWQDAETIKKVSDMYEEYIRRSALG